MATDKEPKKANPEPKKSNSWWSKLPSTEKFMVLGAAALVAYFAIRAMMGGGSSSGTTATTSSPVVGSSGSSGSSGDAAAISSLESGQSQLAQQMTQQLQTLQQQNAAALQAVSQQNTSQIAAMQQSLAASQSQTASQYQNQLSGIQSLLGKMATGSGGSASNPSAGGSTVPSYPSTGGSTAPSYPSTSISYMPSSTPKSVVNAMEKTANTHVVGLPTGGYVAASGANNYNASVNAAGGQWMQATNGKNYFYKGFYNGNHFVSNSTNNPAPASNGPNTVVSTTHGYLIYPKGQVPSNLTNVKS